MAVSDHIYKHLLCHLPNDTHGLQKPIHSNNLRGCEDITIEAQHSLDHRKDGE